MAEKMRKTWIKLKRGLIAPKHVHKIGANIWLFLYMLDIVDWETGKIAGWRDLDAADALELNLRNVRDQRQKLEREGYISCKQALHGQEITIHNWTNPREYSGQVINPSRSKSEGWQDDSETEDEIPETLTNAITEMSQTLTSHGDNIMSPLTSHGDNIMSPCDAHGDTHGSSQNVTPTYSSQNHISNDSQYISAARIWNAIAAQLAPELGNVFGIWKIGECKPASFQDGILSIIAPAGDISGVPLPEMLQARLSAYAGKLASAIAGEPVTVRFVDASAPGPEPVEIKRYAEIGY